MDIKCTGVAGTMESSDAMVTIEKGGSGIQLQLTSPVIHRFGNHMRSVSRQLHQCLQRKLAAPK